MKRSLYALALLIPLFSAGCALGTGRPFATPNTFDEIAQAQRDLPGSIKGGKLRAFHGTIVWAKEDLGTLFLMHVRDIQSDTLGGYLLVDCPGGCTTLAQGHLVAALGRFYDGIRVHDTTAIREATGAVPFGAIAVYDYDSGKIYWMGTREKEVTAWQNGTLFASTSNGPVVRRESVTPVARVQPTTPRAPDPAIADDPFNR